MSTNNATRGQRVNAKITALLRARHSLLWIQTREEARVERALISAVGEAKYEMVIWDCARGLMNANGEAIDPNLQDPVKAMAAFAGKKTTRGVLVLRDIHRWFDPVTLRNLRDFAREFQALPARESKAIILLSPAADVPPDLAGEATLIDYPLPDRAEIGQLLREIMSGLGADIIRASGDLDAIVDASVGLTAQEAANCFAVSIVTKRCVDPATVGAEKKSVIDREKVLTWYDPDPLGLDAIGGLEPLKDWLTQRHDGFTAEARAFGLPAPKGVLLVGVPGCGKSLTAKAVASAWNMPLLRLDLGGLKSKFVGDSEANIRRALATAEAVSPCVLWIDEIEKALAGATGPQGDGGVSADALGTILSWMQERSGAVFVIATANDIRALPPELLRKGRWDELFFVDLPNAEERAAILATALRKIGRDPETLDLAAVAEVTDTFSGAEVAQLVPDALFAAFSDGRRPLVETDLVAAAEAVSPLAETARDRITELRKWAEGCARFANRKRASRVAAASGGGRDMDV